MRKVFLFFALFSSRPYEAKSDFFEAPPPYSCDQEYIDFEILRPWTVENKKWTLKFRCDTGNEGVVETSQNDVSSAGVSMYDIVSDFAKKINFPKFDQPCKAIFAYCGYRKNSGGPEDEPSFE